MVRAAGGEAPCPERGDDTAGVRAPDAPSRPTRGPGFTYVHLPPEGRAPRRGFPGEGAPRLRWGACEPQAVPGPLPGKSRDARGQSERVCAAPGPAGTALAPTPHTTAPRDGHAVTPRAAEGTGVGGPGSLPGGVWFVAASACRRPGGLSNGHSIPSLEAEVQGHGAGRAPLPGSQTAVPSLSSPQFPSVLSAPCLLVRTPVRSD